MAEIKTKPTPVTVADFLDTVENPVRRADGKIICEMMTRITGEKPRMWGPTIIGFGSYHYKYDSGHEGTMCRIGFAPRKAELVLYILCGSEGEAERLARLGKHKTGKSCLYIKRLSDVDQDVLEEMCSASLAYMNEKYPE